MRTLRAGILVVAALAPLGCNTGFVPHDSGAPSGEAGTGPSSGTAGDTAATGAAGTSATGTAGDQGAAGTGALAGASGAGTAGTSATGAAGISATGAGGSGAAGTGTGAGGTGAAGTGAAGTTGDPTMHSGPFKMLVFSWTTGFHHDSIPVSQQMAKDIGANNPIQTFTVDIANVSAADPTGSCLDNAQKPIPNCAASVAVFNDANLKNYEIVYFANPTGDDFSRSGDVGVMAKAALEKYMNAGGAYIGVHSATDFEKGGNWTFYNDLLGALFDKHDNDGTPGTVVIQDLQVNHPVVKGLPKTYAAQDEWYYQLRNPEGRPGITILAKLAADSRPVIWVRELTGGGRMVYTIRGHAIARFAEPWMRQLFLQGVMWATHRLK